MQQVLFVGGEEKTLSLLKDYLKDRSPVIDTDNNILYIKDSVTDPDNNQVFNVLRKITTTADNKNIIIDDDDNVSLKDSINLKGITVKPYDNAPSEYGNVVLGTISPTKTILLLSNVSEVPGTISGDIFEVGDNITSAYHISLSNTGSRALSGCSSKEKARFCQVLDKNGTTWYGLKFLNDDVNSTIYFHGFDTRPETNLPPIEYDDDFFESVNVVTDDADYASTIVDIASFSSWDFTSIPSGWNNGSSNDGFDFGGGLVMRTGHASTIVTGGQSRPGEFGNNIGYLQIANSMRITQNNYIELTIPREQTALIYFTTTSSTNSRTVELYDKDKETVLAREISTEQMRYKVLRYTNTSEYSKTVYICTEGGAVRFYYISNYDTNSVDPSSAIADIITNLPPTGEDGDPNVIKLNNLVLTLEDLNKFANVCKNSDQQIVLDLSNCTVANDAVIWNTTIFMDCNALNTLYMPKGVTAIRNNVFSGCSFMDRLFLNPELTEIYGTAYGTSTIGVLGATQVRTLEITNPSLKLGGYWATASSLRYVVFPSNYSYSGGYGILSQTNGAAADAWLNSVPNYMKLCFQENLVRQLKSDSNPWWFTSFGNGPQYSYALYGVDSKGNYLLAPWDEISSDNWQSGEIRWGNKVIFPAK